MHPVLADAVLPFAERIQTVSLSEAQVSPDSEHRRWCGQQVVEHLILDFQKSTEEMKKRLTSGNSPAVSATLLQWILKVQVCIWGSMPRGVSSALSRRPSRFIPQDGETLAVRLLEAARDLDRVLADCRIRFGMRPCGYHPMYGPLRIEEWRIYSATHCRLHQSQFDETIRLARKYPQGLERARSVSRQAAGQSREND